MDHSVFDGSPNETHQKDGIVFASLSTHVSPKKGKIVKMMAKRLIKRTCIYKLPFIERCKKFEKILH